jgi:FkbM family methyltransferase
MLSKAMPNATGTFGLGHVLELAVAPDRPMVLRTKTSPPFWLAVYRKVQGHKGVGPDATWEALGATILVHGFWEKTGTDLYYKVLTNACKDGFGLVVDIGGFVGYFTMLSAMMGCRVHVWEGSPQHASMLHMSVWLNGMSERVTIHNNICGLGSQPLPYAGTGMDGHVAGSFLNSDNPLRRDELGDQYAVQARKDVRSGHLVYPLAIDDVIKEEVLLLKVDVEGYEPEVFKSAQRLLKRQLVRYVLFEYNMWRAMSKAQGTQMVLDIISLGYSVYTVPFSRCKSVQITTRQQIDKISAKLMNNTCECARYDTYMLAVRRDMPVLYEPPQSTGSDLTQC